MARIAVIGAGLGALAASARLAVAGHRVTVYERGETYGGALGRYTREGFRFDTGPGLLHLPAVYRDLFLKTGRESLEESVALVRLDPAVRHVLADGRAVSLPSASRSGVIEALDGALGRGAGERWTDLLGRARTAWEATRRRLLEEPLYAGEVPAAQAASARDPYPALRRKGLLRRRTPTLAEVAADELRDPGLVSLLTGHACAWGLDPDTAPASAAVLPYLEHTFGSWYVGGGMRELARALYERCLARGVTFRFGTAARDVRVTDGRVTGVDLAAGAGAEADGVVVGCAWRPPSVRRVLGEPGGSPEGGASGSARCTVLLALRGGRPAGTVHRTLVHRADAPRQPLTVLRPDDPTLVPDADHETAVLSVPVPMPVLSEAGDRERAQDGREGQRGREGRDMERLADAMVAAADAAGLGLGDRVLWRETRTPADNEAETGSPHGLVPPPALAGRQHGGGQGGPHERESGSGGGLLGEPNRSPVDGLYLAGGWAHPGGGLAHAGMSGALVAGLIVEGDGWRGSH